MISVVNKYKHTPTNLDFYIGRGSPLGNPFSWHPGVDSKFRVADRAEAIKKFTEYLDHAIMNDVVVVHTLDQIAEVARNYDVNLVCFCKPKDCHGDIIKRVLDRRIERQREHQSKWLQGLDKK
jgi:hypothetical protein